MTAEELKSKIGFKTIQNELGYTVITGGLIVSHEVLVFPYDKYFEQLCRDAKDVIRENIAREIYGWQRREFFEALDEYMRWHVPAYHGAAVMEANAARDRLLKAARYQESFPKKEGR